MGCRPKKAVRKSAVPGCILRHIHAKCPAINGPNHLLISSIYCRALAIPSRFYSTTTMREPLRWASRTWQ